MEEINNEKASIGMKILCFFIPIAGLIIYATNYKTSSVYAKGCGIASIIGAGIGAFLAIIATLIIIPMSFFIYRNAIDEVRLDRNYYEQTDIEEYNETFEEYEGNRVSSISVKMVINLVKIHNSIYDATSPIDNNYIEIEYNNKKIGTDYSKINVNSKNRYSIKIKYNAEGYINKIIIKEGSKI